MLHEEEKTQRTKVRYRLQNKARFFRALIVFGMILLVLFFLLLKPHESVTAIITPTPTESISPTPSASPSPTASPIPEGMRLAPLLVVLDPGHGGRDPGAVSPTDKNVHESDIVLDVALMVRDSLVAAGIPVSMTRETDTHLAQTVDADLQARKRLANDADATIFVSIHVNSYDLKQRGGADVRGMELYYYQGTLLTYAAFDALMLSNNLATAVYTENEMPVGEPIARSLSVLRNTQMPAALVELGYLTNKEDREKLMDQAFLKKTAAGISSGILLSLEQIGADMEQLTVLKREQ